MDLFRRPDCLFVVAVIVSDRDEVLMVEHANEQSVALVPDTLRGAMAAVAKRQSMASATPAVIGSNATVPRSTSQPGNARRASSLHTMIVMFFFCMIVKVMMI